MTARDKCQRTVVEWTGPALPPAQATVPYYYGLEQALIDSFKREALKVSSSYANTAGISAVAYLRVKGGRSVTTPYFGDAWSAQDSSALRQWWDRITGGSPEAEKNFGRWEFAAIVTFDRRYQPPQPIFNSYALSPAIVGPLRDLETKIGGWPGSGADQEDDSMNTYSDYVGADGGSHPEVASHAVRSVSQQNPSPVYGYFRAPIEGISHQKIYLFNTLEEARGWFMGVIHGPAQLYDYVAVFAAADLQHPVAGLESFGHTMVSGDAYVGTLWPFLLGLPLGGLGGYFYRGWRDAHPGRWIPGIPADHSVGGPWLDLVGNESSVGGPWLDLVDPYGSFVTDSRIEGPWDASVGAEDPRERRRTSLQTRALIESAKREALDAQAMAPAAAWVWSLDPTGPSSSMRAELTATQLIPFSSVEQAQDYMFERIHTPHVALALFDTAATRHWPNPVRWTKSDDPAYEPLIAQRVAQYAPVRMAGDRAGFGELSTSVGAALGDVRRRAQILANKRAGSAVGIIHTTKDNLWHALAFRDEQDADDWLKTATQDPSAYTYAAYYDKDDAAWPQPVAEKIGGPGSSKLQGALVGSALDDTRAHAKSLATAKRGFAAGVVRLVDGSWSSLAFPSLDAAIDWLSSLTANKTSFMYAAAFEKDSDGTAYFQQEEFGAPLAAPSQRALPATSGEYGWRAA